MNPAVILELIGDLYAQVAEQQRENQRLRLELARLSGDMHGPTSPEEGDTIS